MDVPVLANQQELIYINPDIGCNLEDLPRAMDDRNIWGERELGKSALSDQLDDDDDDD